MRLLLRVAPAPAWLWTLSFVPGTVSHGETRVSRWVCELSLPATTVGPLLRGTPPEAALLASWQEMWPVVVLWVCIFNWISEDLWWALHTLILLNAYYNFVRWRFPFPCYRGGKIGSETLNNLFKFTEPEVMNEGRNLTQVFLAPKLNSFPWNIIPPLTI